MADREMTSERPRSKPESVTTLTLACALGALAVMAFAGGWAAFAWI
jgi:hypothetical protein